MNTVSTIDFAISQKREITVERSGINDSKGSCIPILQTEQLLLVHWLDDFIADGYKIYRINDVTSVSMNDADCFYEKILREEGIINQLVPPSIFNLASWKTVINEINDKYKYFILECELLQEFFLGMIVNVLNTGIEFISFDSKGIWDDEVTFISYDDITSITLNDRYTNTISKYISPI